VQNTQCCIRIIVVLCSKIRQQLPFFSKALPRYCATIFIFIHTRFYRVIDFVLCVYHSCKLCAKPYLIIIINHLPIHRSTPFYGLHISPFASQPWTLPRSPRPDRAPHHPPLSPRSFDSSPSSPRYPSAPSRSQARAEAGCRAAAPPTTCVAPGQ